MKLIVGLGNPGREYENTRHNVGAIFIDYLKKKEIPSGIILAKTDVFMNDSGTSVRKMVDYYKLGLDFLCVVHDDLDIPLGSYKIQKGKGPKLHNGILSVENELGSEDFWRVRIGVDIVTP
jgi:PTH1 family peptidyl-tRNA hydrolase